MSQPLSTELLELDKFIYRGVASAPTPSLDEGFRRLSKVADNSVLWFGTAGALALLCGRRGRRAALNGVVAIGLASSSVNLGLKSVARRNRPDREDAAVPGERHVPMPESTSFPSGHSASAFAFSEAVSSASPTIGVPVRVMSAAVAYSRVHTGVHYPGDVVVGVLIGMTVGEIAPRVVDLLVKRSAFIRRLVG